MLYDKRKDYISAHDAFMMIAEVISQRSKDPNTQVGCAIVSEDNRILSVGYNGFPNGISDDKFPWTRDKENELDNKYMYVCHAELNAILNFRGDNTQLSGSTIYVTLFPCHECVKAIIQAGIKKVYYLSDKYDGTNDNIAAKKMLSVVGIEYSQYRPISRTSLSKYLKSLLK